MRQLQYLWSSCRQPRTFLSMYYFLSWIYHDHFVWFCDVSGIEYPPATTMPLCRSSLCGCSSSSLASWSLVPVMSLIEWWHQHETKATMSRLSLYTRKHEVPDWSDLWCTRHNSWHQYMGKHFQWMVPVRSLTGSYLEWSSTLESKLHQRFGHQGSVAPSKFAYSSAIHHHF